MEWLQFQNISFLQNSSIGNYVKIYMKLLDMGFIMIGLRFRTQNGNMVTATKLIKHYVHVLEFTPV